MKKALKRNNHELFIVNQDGSKTIIDNTNSVLVGIRGNISAIWGDVSGIRGNISGIWGDVSGIRGDVSGIEGDVSGIEGNVSGIWGDVSGCEISEQAREKGINVKNLIQDE